jgi:hypothetical protein
MSDLSAVRAHKTRPSAKEKTGKQGVYFIEGMIRRLGRVRPAYRRLAPHIQRNIAGLIWQSSSKRREHSRHEGAVIICSALP